MKEHKLLKLTIKAKDMTSNVVEFQGKTIPQALNSSQYDVQIGDWKLGRGVSDLIIEMTADKKPKITITAYPDIMDIDVMAIVEHDSSQLKCDSD